jgi:hypothetical protein
MIILLFGKMVRPDMIYSAKRSEINLPEEVIKKEEAQQY